MLSDVGVVIVYINHPDNSIYLIGLNKYFKLLGRP